MVTWAFLQAFTEEEYTEEKQRKKQDLGADVTRTGFTWRLVEKEARDQDVERAFVSGLCPKLGESS